MPGIRKHGAHRYNIPTSSAAVGTAALPSIWVYDAYAGPQTVIGGAGGIDSTGETVTELTVTNSAAITGAATNFGTIRVTHRDNTGTTKNQLTVAFGTAGFNAAAFVAMDFAVANGATVPGAGTATLTVASGTALPWLLVNGDTITLDDTVAGTGNISGGLTAMIIVQARGS